MLFVLLDHACINGDSFPKMAHILLLCLLYLLFNNLVILVKKVVVNLPVMFYFDLLVAANGEEAWGGASSAHTVWNYCGKLAGKPHPEGVPEGLLPCPSGHTLPGCWTGRKTSLEVLVRNGTDFVHMGLNVY